MVVFQIGQNLNPGQGANRFHSPETGWDGGNSPYLRLKPSISFWPGFAILLKF